MANRLFFGDRITRVFHAYDFGGTAETSENQDLSGVISGNVFGATSNDTRIWVLVTGATALAFDHDWNQQSSDNITFSFNPNGIGVTDNRIIAVHSDGTVEFRSLDGTLQSSEGFTLPGSGWSGFTVTSDRLVFLNTTNRLVRFYTLGRVYQSSEDLSLESGVWNSAVATDNRYHFVNNTNDDTVAYDFSRTRQSGSDITLPTGNWQASLVLFDSSATLTLSTTDTDIRAGEAVDIEIDSDIDISNFVASDCTVTNGTRGALTINSATSATLRVTAGSAGTMTVSIAEDVVDPGNAAASQDFTVNAAPEVDAVLDITLDATSAENGEVVNATFTFDKAVGSFTAADVDVTTAATKGALTDNGDNTFSMPITAPATGNGTIQISVAADVVTPGNNADSASFTYAPPADAVLEITLDATSVENGEIVNATFTLDIAVGGFRRNDVSLTGAPGSARGPLVDNGDNTYSMEITAPATGSGTVTVSVAADRVTPGNNADSASFTYAPPTPTNTAPVFGETSYAFSDLAIASGTVIGTVDATDADNDTLTYSITGTDASKFNIDADGEVTAAETLEYAEDYAINVVADDGTDTTAIAVTINTETVTPRAPSIAVDSTTHNSITIDITAGDDGGESVSDWEYELDGDSTWVSFGNTDLEQTISNLDPGTAYAIKVRGVNSEGNGVASAAVTATTDAALSFGSETIGDQSWIVGSDVSLALPEATGGSGTKVYSLSPTTPAGVTFTAAIPDLDGNPTAVFALTTFIYTATDDDGNGDSVELTFTIVVSAAIVIVPTTSTEATYNAAMGYNVLPESLGALKKINTSGSVESLGNLWYDSDRPYNVALTRPLSVDGDLHVTMGYGNANEVLRYNSLASKADNFVHLVFGNRLKYILPAFQATGNVYSKIAELARMVGATVSFDGNIISVVDRRPFRAKTDGATGTGTGNLDFDSENKAFPTAGYLRIGDEFIGYTGISSGAFTGITRGALGSEPANHADNAGVLYVNALFSEREILQINASTDTARHHNIIRDSGNAFDVKDDASIAQYRPQPYTLDLGLTRNEDAWIETMFAEYLLELKTLGKLVTLRLRPQKQSFALDPGQFIGIRHGSVTHALRIELIDYHRNSVEIKGRSVATTL